MIYVSCCLAGFPCSFEHLGFREKLGCCKPLPSASLFQLKRAFNGSRCADDQTSSQNQNKKRGGGKIYRRLLRPMTSRDATETDVLTFRNASLSNEKRFLLSSPRIYLTARISCGTYLPCSGRTFRHPANAKNP